ncbi:17656_t:CDS:1 [Cetraspora pellucida]|uniref:17656_t:CDS:1 n=1 Tax=Cetraspora pellucida TaxID=1433469 RepID=A0ACA9LBK2_9GLOM|nr:17656_t:CDS:1 [Cetraspora pellucida]
MNKEPNLNDKQFTKTPEGFNNEFIPGKPRPEVEFLVIEKTGRLWPHHGGKKALSASTLTRILREIEYEEIPEYILLRAAERGKNFHDAVQTFVQSGNHPSFVDLVEVAKLNKLDKRIHETINFLKKNKSLKLGHFLGSEKLHHVFYKDELLATYVDLEFQDYIIELKTSNIKANDSPLALLIFEIQLLIQYLCTGKNIYLL